MRIASLFVGDDLSWGFLTFWSCRASDAVGTCRLLVEEPSIQVGIAWIFFLYLFVEEIDQILVFLAVVLSDRRLPLQSLLSLLFWAVSLLWLRSTLFVEMIGWISSGLSAVIVACP